MDELILTLNVPSTDEVEARKLGAELDLNSNLWYVPSNVDKAPFKRWFNKDYDNDGALLTNTLAVVSRDIPCKYCTNRYFFTAIISNDFYVQEPFETDEIEEIISEEDPYPMSWNHYSHFGIFLLPEINKELPIEVKNVLKNSSICSNYHINEGKPYNLCPHCKRSDYDMNSLYLDPSFSIFSYNNIFLEPSCDVFDFFIPVKFNEFFTFYFKSTQHEEYENKLK